MPRPDPSRRPYGPAEFRTRSRRTDRRPSGTELACDERELLERVAVGGDEPWPDADGLRHLGDVEVPVRVHGETVRRAEAARCARIGTADAGEHASGAIEDRHARGLLALDRTAPERALPDAPDELGDVDAAAGENDLRRALNVGDLAHKAPVEIEDLDAVALAVADVDAPVRRHADAVRQHELPRAGPRLAP